MKKGKVRKREIKKRKRGLVEVRKILRGLRRNHLIRKLQKLVKVRKRRRKLKNKRIRKPRKRNKVKVMKTPTKSIRTKRIRNRKRSKLVIVIVKVIVKVMKNQLGTIKIRKRK
uniref:Uncharacterized protein n=1 Tax=Arcella intermedia TaxID=1963864 RepID=A0A6B2LNB0_9EUKA